MTILYQEKKKKKEMTIGCWCVSFCMIYKLLYKIKFIKFIKFFWQKGISKGWGIIVGRIEGERGEDRRKKKIRKTLRTNLKRKDISLNT